MTNDNTREAGGGAVDLTECPSIDRFNFGRCKCEPICVCGWRKHVAIHGPFFGQPPGSKPYGHEYKPKEQS